ncbi:hypothetical protein HAX54_038687 [Datura stramonium]|uniref:Uncharacterized protein n=1 Tax=Datura stramonium TaxID=4076 RepID=A0ABS8RMW4_DATST|nr:hypothetical protein [Datura stramonium]
MGSEICPRKLHYDVRMSKRTRRPLNYLNAISDERREDLGSDELHYDDVSMSKRTIKPLMNYLNEISDERKYERKSLQQLMIEDDQENQLQQPQEILINGFKFKKIDNEDIQRIKIKHDDTAI